MPARIASHRERWTDHLAAICVFARVSHGQHTPPSKLQILPDLVLEFAIGRRVDRLASAARSRWVSPLNHKAFDVPAQHMRGACHEDAMLSRSRCRLSTAVGGCCGACRLCEHAPVKNRAVIVVAGAQCQEVFCSLRHLWAKRFKAHFNSLNQLSRAHKSVHILHVGSNGSTVDRCPPTDSQYSSSFRSPSVVCSVTAYSQRTERCTKDTLNRQPTNGSCRTAIPSGVAARHRLRRIGSWPRRRCCDCR